MLYQTNVVFKEIAGGLNYLDASGQWQPSSDQISVTANGGAAMNCQTPLVLSGNIENSPGAVNFTLPDGQSLASSPVAVAYYNGNQSVLLAPLQDSYGFLLPTGNQVVYSNTFSGYQIDLRYTHTKSSVEQDLIIRSQLPDPSTLGFDPATTRLVLLTAFTQSPVPQVTQLGEDERLDFGSASIGSGKAFFIGDESEAIQVNKQWIVISNVSYLMESVPFQTVAAQMQTLPPSGGGGNSPAGDAAAGCDLRFTRGAVKCATGEPGTAKALAAVAAGRAAEQKEGKEFFTEANEDKEGGQKARNGKEKIF